jgi:hypothetical protein
MSITPRTDARELAISIQNEDSCCAIYVKIDGKEYEGGLVDSDFARELECENARLKEALESLAYYSRFRTETRVSLRNRINAALSPAIPDSKP